MEAQEVDKLLIFPILEAVNIFRRTSIHCRLVDAPTVALSIEALFALDLLSGL